MIPGEIHLADFPFGGSAGMKLRPVLLLSGSIGDVPEVVVAYISSVLPLNALPSDILMDPADPEHRSTQLKIKSVLPLHKIATIHRRVFVRRLGAVSPKTLVDVHARLRALLDL